MELTKKINGIEAPLSVEEVQEIQSEWIDNEQYEILRREEKEKILERKQKDEKVASLKVTTQSGNEFNANEFSQSKMTTAIAVLGDGETTDWKLADDSWVSVTKEELKEALRLAGEAQTIIWKG